jgi:cytosine/creatinine deaminase
MSVDLLITNARMRGRQDPTNIAVDHGRVVAIDREPAEARRVVDAANDLVTESFVDPHLHLCKVHTSDMVDEAALRAYTADGMKDASRAIAIASQVKDRYEEGWIYENARRTVREGIRHGVTHLQAFADTDGRARLEGIKALLRVRDEFRGVLDMRVVAFPQDGVVRDRDAAEYVRRAVGLGADVVGGIPWIESTEADARVHIDAMLDIASEFDRDVAMLVDDAGDPSLRTTEMLARAAIERGLIDRVVACHARAMGVYPQGYYDSLVTLLLDSRMTFVTDPHTGSLCMRALDLGRRGVPVAFGQDDIADAYYPFGQHNMLEVAFLAAHILVASTSEDLDLLIDMVTTKAADVLRIEDHRLEVGSSADLVVLDGRDVREVLTRHRPPRVVIGRGRVLAETSTESVLSPEVP